MTNPLEQVGNQRKSRKFTFKDFSMKGKAEELLSKMENDIFVLGRIAIKGQSTLIYAQTNAGKTLLIIYLLIKAIKQGDIDPSNVFYLNADDHGKGFAQKLQLADKYGFEMIGGGFEGNADVAFSPDMLQELLEERVEAGEAGNTIVILDTVKKFVDHMDKKGGRKFGMYTRPFITQGGTLIMLSHVNKHKDGEGKSIYSGTTDLIDDADCAFTLEVSEGESTRTITFEHQKSRGDVALNASYSYTRKEGQSYFELLGSVTAVSAADAERERELSDSKQFVTDNIHIVNEVVACIRGGIVLKTELTKEVAERTAEARKRVNKVLSKCTGNGALQYWLFRTGEHNKQIYRLNKATAKSGAKI